MKKKEFDGSTVIIMTCSNCNVHCKHCYINYSGNFDAEELYNLCENLTQKHSVQLNGTEILLHPEYFKSLELVKYPYVLTNGLQLHKEPELIDELVKVGVKYVGMSYHFGIHEEISKVPRYIIEENIPKLRAKGILPELRTTLTSKNYLMISSMCEEAINMGAGAIKFTNYMKTGSAKNMPDDNILSQSQVDTFFKLLQEERRKYSKDTLLIRRCGTFGKDCTKCKSSFNCLAGRNMAVITPNMNVYPCIFLMEPGYEIGKVEDGKIWIYQDIDNDGHECLAKEVNNYNKKLF